MTTTHTYIYKCFQKTLHTEAHNLERYLIENVVWIITTHYTTLRANSTYSATLAELTKGEL